MDTAKTPRPNRVPVSVISGFLGSGKTTLLNRLIRHPGMTDTAVIVNEFGEVGIDHVLVDSALENAVVMENGCVCCTIRGDLMDTIDDIFAKAEAGLLPRFSNILIEPTGLADPGPIVHALDQMESEGHACARQAVLTLVDAQQGLRQIEEHAEASQQIAAADVVLVTKPDLATESGIARLRETIAALNPGAPIRTVEHGAIDPAALFDLAAASAATAPISPGGQGHADHPHAHHAHGHETHAHGDIRSLAIVTPRRLAWARLRDFLERVYSLRGEAFLRVKGIVRLEEAAEPVLIQGVGNAFSPPRPLAGRIGDGEPSRLVFIYRGLDGAAIEKSFEVMVLAAEDASNSGD